MTATKKHTQIWDAQVLTAGAADVVVNLNLGAHHGAYVTRRITNGATGPTVEATIRLEASHDGVTWYPYGSALGGGTTDDDVTSAHDTIPITIPHMRALGGENTVQDVTARLDVSTITHTS